MDTYPVSSKGLEKYYHVDGKQLGQHYKDHLSDYHSWNQKSHATKWMLFPENLGSYLSLDETALSNGELYTLLTNKAAKGRKGSIVAMIKGTRSEDISNILLKLPRKKRKKVKEVTLDMAPSMNKIVNECFPRASKVIDRFHVQKLAYDALQEIRIKHRWEAIDEEAEEMKYAAFKERDYKPTILDNGDTKKQLLARSRYLLFKSQDKWSPNQKCRAAILFAQYPDIKKAYDLTHSLRALFNSKKAKEVILTKLAVWYDKVEKAGFNSFQSVLKTMQAHYANILNFFDNRSTNAAAESFNAKLKSFRSAVRGVRDLNFFLFRVAKIYA